MNWKTLLTTCLIAALPLGCDSNGEEGDEGSHETEGHETEGDSHESEGECDESEGDDHDDEDDGHDHDHGDECGAGAPEVITTVTLTFTSENSETVTAAFSDPDGDGGASGSADPIVLAADTTYSLAVQFTNELEEPAEDITGEVEAEAEEHQVFIYGDSVTGPASAGDGLVTHEYADVESDYTDNNAGDDLPVGILSTVTTGAAGADGELRVMLRHLPELNGTPVKTAELAASLAGGGTLPGDVDADVGFDLSVQ